MPGTQAILLIGPTGSGKTPLGDLLERRGLWGRRCRHFDFGRHLRRIVETPSAAGYLAPEDIEFLRSVLRSGALLEDEHFPIAANILRAFIAERGIGTDAYVVLNGLPRHVGQAADLDATVEVRAVIELSCTPEVVFGRIHTDAGGDRTERTDDDEESVRSKLDIYARRTTPLLDHFRRRDVRIETLKVGVDTTAGGLWQELNRRG